MKILNEINGTLEKRAPPKRLISRARKVESHGFWGSILSFLRHRTDDFFPVGLPSIRPSHLSSLTAENKTFSPRTIPRYSKKDPSSKPRGIRFLESRASILRDPRRRRQIRPLRRRTSTIGSFRGIVTSRISQSHAEVQFQFGIQLASRMAI